MPVTALWDCTYIGLEVIEAIEARTEVHPEPTLADTISRANAEFGVVQRSLDSMGAEKRTREWANERK